MCVCVCNTCVCVSVCVCVCNTCVCVCVTCVCVCVSCVCVCVCGGRRCVSVGRGSFRCGGGVRFCVQPLSPPRGQRSRARRPSTQQPSYRPLFTSPFCVMYVSRKLDSSTRTTSVTSGSLGKLSSFLDGCQHSFWTRIFIYSPTIKRPESDCMFLPQYTLIRLCSCKFKTKQNKQKLLYWDCDKL